MTKITNSKQRRMIDSTVGLVSVIGILNLLFVCNLVLEYWNLVMKDPVC